MSKTEPLENFLRQVLLTYKGLTTCLDKLVDVTTKEYESFHKLSLEAHVGFVELRLRKETYWLQRVSNIRNTAGYTQYQYQLTKRTVGEEDDPNIAFRLYREKWLDWKTVNMNLGSLT